jgi:adenine phosphoribosyltransferase
MNLDEALSLIRPIPDYPKPGILFQDITPLLADALAFSIVTAEVAKFIQDESLIAGIEARGFIFASAAAQASTSGFVPIRKAGKLPFTTISKNYGLEYGEDVLEMHTDALSTGDKVLLIDDVLATGGTFEAAISLIHSLGAEVYHILCIIEISELEGRKRLERLHPDIPISSLVTY